MMLLTAIFNVSAEDVISVMPFGTEAGVTHDANGIFEVKMVNVEEVFTAFQFDLYLPVGMTLDNTLISSKRGEVENDPISLSDRCSIDDKFVSNYNQLTSDKPGYVLYRVLVYNSNNWTIWDNEGAVINLQYLTDNTLQSGIYPIYVNNVIIATSGSGDNIGGNSDDVTVPVTTSYVKVGNPSFDGALDLGLEGYIPSFVVESLNADMTAATTSIDLTHVTGLGAQVATTKNQNSIIVVSEGSELASNDNVLVKSGDSYTMNNLVLIDKTDFKSPVPEFVANHAVYTRQMTSKYGSIILPFADNQSSTSNIKYYDPQMVESGEAGTGTILHKQVESGAAAYTPYIFEKVSEGSSITIEATNVTVTDADCNVSTIDGSKASFIGTMTKQVLTSSDSPSIYYIKDDAYYVIADGQNVTVNPFRAYFDIPSSSAKMFTFAFAPEDATSISDIDANNILDGDVYDISGRKVSGKLANGVYIVNGKKVLVRR